MRHCLQKDVALAIGMSEQVFSNKMNGLRSFSAKDYKALADFFNTSVDYLMGRTLDPWPVDNPTPLPCLVGPDGRGRVAGSGMTFLPCRR